jgi:hypothetical protein
MKKLLSLIGLSAIAATVFLAGPAAASPDANSVTKATSGTSAVRQDSANITPSQLSTNASTQAVSGRICWTPRNGWWILTATNTGTFAGQAVMVSVSELDSAGNEFVGSAHLSVYSVAVRNNVVDALVFIDWGSGITVCTHYLG